MDYYEHPLIDRIPTLAKFIVEPSSIYNKFCFDKQFKGG